MAKIIFNIDDEKHIFNDMPDTWEELSIQDKARLISQKLTNSPTFQALSPDHQGRIRQGIITKLSQKEHQIPSPFIQRLAQTELPEKIIAGAYGAGKGLLGIPQLMAGRQASEAAREIAETQTIPIPHTPVKIPFTMPFELGTSLLSLGGISGLTKDIVPVLLNIYRDFPTLARFIPSAVHGGLTFGMDSLLRESSEQLQQGRFDVNKLIDETGGGYALGLGIGGLGRIGDPVKRIITSGTFAGGMKALDDKVKTGEINPNDVLFNTILVSAFTAINAPQVTQQMREDAVNQLKRATTIRLMQENPNLNPHLAEEAADHFASALQTEFWRKTGKIPNTGDIEDFATKIINGWKIYMQAPTNVPAETVIKPEVMRLVAKSTLPTRPADQFRAEAPDLMQRPVIPTPKPTPVSLPEAHPLKPTPPTAVLPEQIEIPPTPEEARRLEMEKELETAETEFEKQAEQARKKYSLWTEAKGKININSLKAAGYDPNELAKNWHIPQTFWSKDPAASSIDSWASEHRELLGEYGESRSMTDAFIEALKRERRGEVVSEPHKQAIVDLEMELEDLKDQIRRKYGDDKEPRITAQIQRQVEKEVANLPLDTIRKETLTSITEDEIKQAVKSLTPEDIDLTRRAMAENQVVPEIFRKAIEYLDSQKQAPEIPKVKPMGETFKEMAEENSKLADIIEKTQPDTLAGFDTTYKKTVIDGDLFYEGGGLTRPIRPSQVATLLSDEQKKKLLTPVKKEPWQMTREEFNKEAETVWFKGSRFFDKEGQLKDMHRQIVKEALEEGKPVPPEVLADFPDLAKLFHLIEHTPQEIKEREVIDSLLDKARNSDYEEFSKYWLSKLNTPEVRDVQDALTDLVESHGEELNSIGLWRIAQGKPRYVIKKNRIRVEPLRPDLLSPDDITLIKKFTDFISKEYPNKSLHITVGTQPVSVASKEGFRIGKPTAIPVEDWLIYDTKLIPAFKKLADKYGALEVSTAYDIFHELAHSLELDTEKTADRFAYKLAQKFFSSQQPAEPKIEPAQDITLTGSLEEEAKKYASAEEFVKDNLVFTWLKASPAYENIKSLADVSAKDIKIVRKLLDKEIKRIGDEEVGRQIRNRASYHKIEIPDIRTRPSQLTDLYNQVTLKGIPEKGIPEELKELAGIARKYASAEEFTEALNENQIKYGAERYAVKKVPLSPRGHGFVIYEKETGRQVPVSAFRTEEEAKDAIPTIAPLMDLLKFGKSATDFYNQVTGTKPVEEPVEGIPIGKKLTNRDIYAIVNSVKPVPFDETGMTIKFNFVADSQWTKDIGVEIERLKREFIEKADKYGLEYKISDVRDLTFPPAREGEEPTYQKRITIWITKPKYVKKAEIGEKQELGVYQLSQPITVKSTSGKTVKLPAGETYYAYPKGEGKILLKDGRQVTISQEQLSKLKGQEASAEENPPISGGSSFLKYSISEQERQEIARIAKEKKLSPRQVNGIMRVFTGRRKISDLTTEEANHLIDMLNKIIEGKGGKPPHIPKSKGVMKADFFEKEIKEPGLSQLFFEPWEMFKRLGIWKEIGKPMYDAVEQVTNRVTDQFYKIKDWQHEAFKGIPRKQRAEVSRRIWEIADGTISPEELVKARPIEKKIADEWRVMAEDYADKLKIPIEEREPAYISHIIEDLFRNLINSKYPFPEELSRVIEHIHTKEVFNPFLEKRLGFPLVKKDFFLSASRYIAAAEKKLAYDDALQQINAYLSKGLLPPDTQQYVENVVNYSFLRRPHPQEKIFGRTLQYFVDLLPPKKVKLPPEIAKVIGQSIIEVPRVTLGTKPATKIISSAKELSYMSLIAGNIGTMLKNLTQTLAAYAKLEGLPHQRMIDMLYGYQKAINRMFRPSYWREFEKAGLLQNVGGILENPDVHIRYRVALKDLLFWNMQISEFINRVSTAYAGAKNKMRTGDWDELLEIHPDLRKKAEWINKNLSDTINFKYGSLYRPPWTLSPMGQVAYHLNSFNLKQAQLLLDMTKQLNIKELPKDFKEHPIETLKELSSKQRGQLLHYILALFLFGSTVGASLGISVMGKAGLIDIRPSVNPLFDLFIGLITFNIPKIKNGLKLLIQYRSAIRGWKKMTTRGMEDLLTGVE